ncbi:MAG TPA: amidohydrolase family protein, partial [Sphingomonadales bacterium]|nr:amidohydrolase family protein [Sphingomonadales bacterium]
PYQADIGIRGDTIAAIGELDGARASTVIDARGKAVAPGFINMLSWGVETLIVNGDGLSDLKQGVTLEVFGEGWSWGPWSEAMKAEALEQQADIRYGIEWTTLGEYLEYLERKGVAMNVASFVGATTVRVHEIGYVDRPASAEELARMQDLVRTAMREGALGVGPSLIYAPANFAQAEELIALAKAAGEFGGMYVSHIRSESSRIFEALDEFFRIAREADVQAEIYHLKTFGEPNWSKMDEVLARIEAAQGQGLRVSADMYTYPAAATGLDAVIPLWTQEGGLDAWVERLKEPKTRALAIAEMKDASRPDNVWTDVGPERMLLSAFNKAELKPLAGRRLADVAAERGQEPAETALDLVIADHSRVGVIYFGMSEENVRKIIQKPWVTFGSDEGAYSDDEVFTLSNPHPRAYGTFARVIGQYSRDEGLFPLEEAVRRLTSLPAANLKIKGRGLLKEGNFADVAVFDPLAVYDHATFEQPRQYATGIEHVFVNGVHALKDGEPTGAKGGRAVRGPGWAGGD